MNSNTEVDANLKRCPKFDTCNKNLCPLDLDLEFRTGKTSDKCKWMRKDRNAVMPDDLLLSVPETNAIKLNSISRKRYYQVCL